ncbi:MAG: tRNA (N6-isopentenyl adenosine(37)-C2)-methylthiotransferase MiaB [Ignavibacteriota bacterium]|jgi:tRNA-2-methylthio-N6-dimethylallyladenosine synthase|nr:MAG: tRNA (N6-isopentenyl adenosine(37)-C2)-methylthiotransferase MiaB [Chlorobiota bacterium]MBE7475126.1 tRNA (N6-isopentenyl adenosine(37)-C2)-methylthiotransferase MiaB [Ignavibacteriales bacterium]MBL1122532.1 tRNA (N6-isopentenyl adenosine(37)-C2)-methylthiotransferase MiaB [Ignavibacteriota bacterium]MCE7855923.1 tRNA (N6-isopentenyl adenosine(37)-C2)-methylthiotransferase MiaB [Ignavibacteria bacterium CHB3]GJQ40624.1 MAG: tRNA-2-methylthio-N(6)-dimethylallyladenosine synthase [Ignav
MNKNKVYIETYGCQMNLADTEIVLGILQNNGYSHTKNSDEADVILVNTCSIRDNAEQRIYGRLGNFKTIKDNKPGLIVGVLGCMAERLRTDLVEKKKIVDVVVGPDEYRRLPELIDVAFNGDKGIGVKLSKTETYDDIIPHREDGLQAWISVMRGCDKFCTFCVVPFTRGRERSRSLNSVADEIKQLSDRGFREITLLGQNVDSYKDEESAEAGDFADLLAACAQVDNSIRIRFTTSHPQDLSDKLLYTISSHSNICNYIHLPVQSGSNRILELMNRTYTIEHYLQLVERARKIIPGVSFSTDIITGFPTETYEDHIMTLDVMRMVRFDGAFMFKYSPREGTKAFRMNDDVSEETKSKRLQEIINLQQQISFELNQELIGKEEVVLIEGFSRKSDKFLSGRSDTNKVVIIPADNKIRVGNYVKAKINKATSATLFGDFSGFANLVEENLSLTG